MGLRLALLLLDNTINDPVDDADVELLVLSLDDAGLGVRCVSLDEDIRNVGFGLSLLLLDDTTSELVRLELEVVKNEVWLDVERLPEVVPDDMINDIASELAILDDPALERVVLLPENPVDEVGLGPALVLLRTSIEDVELELPMLLPDEDAEVKVGRALLDVALGCAVNDIALELATLVLDDAVLEPTRLILEGPVEDVGLELGMVLLDDETALEAVKLLLSSVTDTGTLDGAVAL
ncbi:hypothetical protein N7G274_001639 [Stereocaulon virgatum]|uniref:Uncharacterized protein n=1 Tax=Stereocaulon virgatum TaxID=373712 RepID=A0ABR4AK96_9LECA